jgi:hypothetical protein
VGTVKREVWAAFAPVPANRSRGSSAIPYQIIAGFLGRPTLLDKDGEDAHVVAATAT